MQQFNPPKPLAANSATHFVLLNVWHEKLGKTCLTIMWLRKLGKTWLIFKTDSDNEYPRWDAFPDGWKNIIKYKLPKE